jgi:hypothetical protein
MLVIVIFSDKVQNRITHISPRIPHIIQPTSNSLILPHQVSKEESIPPCVSSLISIYLVFYLTSIVVIWLHHARVGRLVRTVLSKLSFINQTCQVFIINHHRTQIVIYLAKSYLTRLSI